jgi:hypothetical protein
MTQAELEALPIDGDFGQREEIRDGRIVRIAVRQTVGVLWSAEDEPTTVTDIYGQRWRVGWHEGVRYRQRLGPLR